MRNVPAERESERLAVKLNTVARKMLKHLHTATATAITATATERGTAQGLRQGPYSEKNILKILIKNKCVV